MSRTTQRILTELGGLREEMRGELGGLREDMRGELGGLREDMRGELGGLREEMRADFKELRTDVRAVGARIDSLNARVDTVIDALADLRTDFDRHTHDS